MRKEDFNLEGTGLDLKKFEELSPEKQKEWKDNLEQFQKDLSAANSNVRGGGFIPTCMPIPHAEKERMHRDKQVWEAIALLKGLVEKQGEQIKGLTKIIEQWVKED